MKIIKGIVLLLFIVSAIILLMLIVPELKELKNYIEELIGELQWLRSIIG